MQTLKKITNYKQEAINPIKHKLNNLGKQQNLPPQQGPVVVLIFGGK